MLGTQLQCLCLADDALWGAQSQNLIPFLEIPLQKEVDSSTSKTLEMGQESKPNSSALCFLKLFLSFRVLGTPARQKDLPEMSLRLTTSQ